MSASNTLPTPTLLGLPPELRLLVYDLLLADLQGRPKHKETYMLPHEYPIYSFETYRTLVLTCKDIRAEAQRYLNTLIMPTLTIHFLSVPDLYDFYQRVCNATPMVRDGIRFSIIDRCALAELTHLITADGQTGSLIHRHSAYQWEEHSSEPWVAGPNGSEYREDGSRRNGSVRGDATIITHYHPVVGGIRVTEEKIEGKEGSAYTEKTGRVLDLDWTSYEEYDMARERWVGYDKDIATEDFYVGVIEAAQWLDDSSGYLDGMKVLVEAVDETDEEEEAGMRMTTGLGTKSSSDERHEAVCTHYR